jgi:pyruvate dehydrogenase E2 component (dihydrolipoamide acetyltransferase)
MPKFGLTMHEGTVQRYFKSVGDSVAAGEPLYEVETEKVLYEVESPAAGIFALALCAEGDVVECGKAVAVIAEAGEDPASLASRYASVAATPAVRNGDKPISSAPAAPPPSSERGRRAVSPVAKKLASELGVDVDRVTGTGPGGRITREDIERAAKQPPAATASARTPRSASRVPLRGTRKIIAERMHQSLAQAAQLTITTEADVTPATELRERLKTQFSFTYTDMIVQACARALASHPRMNSKLESGAIVESGEINVGVAVALEEGLIVPVIHTADRKPLREIALEAAALAEKARTSRLKLEEVTGGTFTVSNLGAFGVDAFTPILNLGETGILGIGRIVEKPAVYRGEITRRAMVTLSLTFDHRVIDGAPAATFLQQVVELLNYGER